MAKLLRVSSATTANWARGKNRINMATADFIQNLLINKRNSASQKEVAEKMNQLFNPKENEHAGFKHRLIHGLDLLLQYQNAKVLIVDDKNSADFLNQELSPEYFVAIMLPTGLSEMERIDLGLLKDRECISLPSFYKSRRSNSAKKLLSDSINNLEEIENPANMICFFVNRWKVIGNVHKTGEEVSKVERKMESIDGFEVYTSETGLVCIKQESTAGEDLILIHTSQVDSLVQWLIEAKNELINES